MRVHFVTEERDVLVYLTNENGIQSEHDEVEKTAGMNMVCVQEELWAPSGEKLTHS